MRHRRQRNVRAPRTVSTRRRIDCEPAGVSVVSLAPRLLPRLLVTRVRVRDSEFRNPSTALPARLRCATGGRILTMPYLSIQDFDVLHDSAERDFPSAPQSCSQQLGEYSG